MKQKQWLKIIITVNPQLVDSLTDFLVGMIGAGVESGAKDEPNYGVVTAWLEEADYSEAERKQLIKRIKEHLDILEETFHLSGTTLNWELVNDQDWGAEWKKFFTPFAIVPNLVIVPGWEEYTPQEGEQVLVMDPGMAFGTGHHDTTRLSLELIRTSQEKQQRRTLLDVGTGTGILAMGGIVFGIESALAIDNDPDAVIAAQDNIKRNGLQKKNGKGIEVSDLPLSEISGVFDIVAANIIHDALIAMSDDLVARVAVGGSLILSGILFGEQLDTIIRVFTEAGLQKEESLKGEEWAAVRFIK